MKSLQNINNISSTLKLVHTTKSFEFKNHNRLVLPLIGSFQVIKFEDIVYCSADSSYVNIFTTDGRKITLAKTLKWVQAQLNHLFIRTHQSYLINIMLVQRYDLHEATLQLEGGVQVPVSRSMKKEMGEYFKC